MKLRRVNLLQQLEKERRKAISEQDLFNDITTVFKELDAQRDKIITTLEKGKSTSFNEFCFDHLDTNRIYHINQIRNICIDYRLRFLDSSLFKADLPSEAINEIRRLESCHQIKIEGFKIVAPSKSFKLKNADDPLLFAPIGNGYFYLIHKWGNDLHPFRKLLMYPLKTLDNLLLGVFLLSILLTFIVPHGDIAVNSSAFFILFLFMFKSVVGIVIYISFSRGKNVSSAIWNSKYYNA